MCLLWVFLKSIHLKILAYVTFEYNSSGPLTDMCTRKDRTAELAKEGTGEKQLLARSGLGNQ